MLEAKEQKDFFVLSSTVSVVLKKNILETGRMHVLRGNY